MIMRLTLRDLMLVARLQKQYASLCPIEALTRPRSPLWTAFASLLPFDEARASTFVLYEPHKDGRDLSGFVQVEQPATRPEMHVCCISPRLDDRPDTWEDARTVWNRLLNHVVSEAGERCLQRVYAVVPDGSEALRLLLGLGFSVYTREDVYRLAADAHPQAIAQDGIRPEQSTDAPEIDRLLRGTVPRLVQQAEALPEHGWMEAICGPVSWEHGEGFVLEDRSGTSGYGHLMPGQTGHWLTVVVRSQAYDQAGLLLDYGLALLNYYPSLPVYCAVREYQGGIRAPLEDRGFVLASTQCRMVRHTTVRVTEPARTLVHALEKRAEAPTPTASHTEGQ